MAEVSPEERAKMLLEGWATTLGTLVKAVVDKYRDEGRDLVEKAFRELGREAGKAELERLKIRKRDVKAFAKIMEPWDPVFKLQSELKELTEKKMVRHVLKCPLAEHWKVVGAPSEMCDLWYSFDQGVAETVNPKMTFKVLKSLYRGDPYCERVVELK